VCASVNQSFASNLTRLSFQATSVVAAAAAVNIIVVATAAALTIAPSLLALCKVKKGEKGRKEKKK
jgi:hypothetical protein